MEETKKRSRTYVLEWALLVLIAAVLAWLLTWKPGKGKPDQGELASSIPGEEAEKPVKLDLPALPFERVREGLPETGQWRGDPAVADLDKDGHLDIVASLRKPEEEGRNLQNLSPEERKARMSKFGADSTIYAFLGDGKGHWRASCEGIPKGLGYGGAAVADFDGDGNPDIAFTTHKGPPKVFLGDGKGAWRDGSEGLDNPTVLVDVVAADFDGDGRPDLACLSMFEDRTHPEQGGIYLYRNLGNGKWAPLQEKPLLGGGIYGNDLLAADLDGDGDADLAAATVLGLRVFLNDGKGAFTDTSLGLLRPEVGNALSSIDAGDLDGDGRPELVAGGAGIGISVFTLMPPEKKEGAPFWKQILQGPHPKDFVHGLALGDLEGDGDLDLVVSSVQWPELPPRLTVFENDGKGNLQEKGLVKGGSGKARVRLGDFDEDGRLDILTVYTDKPGGTPGGVVVWLQR